MFYINIIVSKLKKKINNYYLLQEMVYIGDVADVLRVG